MENNNQQSFWQFSDQLRVQQTSNLANLSLNDSIWSNSSSNMNNNYMPTKSERRNFDIRVGGDINSKEPVSDFNDGWKQMMNSTPNGSLYNYNPLIGGGGAGLNGGFNKGIYDSKPMYAIANNNNLNNINLKGNNKVGGEDEFLFSHPHKNFKKNTNPNKKQGESNNNNNNDSNNKSKDAKKFKTLPASESLPRNETIGGYIFVCNNDTMAENLKRQLFGMFLHFIYPFPVSQLYMQLLLLSYFFFTL